MEPDSDLQDFPKCSLEAHSWKGHLLWQGKSSLQMQPSHTTGKENILTERGRGVTPGPSPVSAKGQPTGPGQVVLP